MTLDKQNYAQFYLVQEMMGTVETIRKFDPSCAAPVAGAARRKGHLLLSGEGSSRIMPAKNAGRMKKDLAGSCQIIGVRTLSDAIGVYRG